MFSQLRNLLIAKYAHSCYDSNEERDYKKWSDIYGKIDEQGREAVPDFQQSCRTVCRVACGTIFCRKKKKKVVFGSGQAI